MLLALMGGVACAVSLMKIGLAGCGGAVGKGIQGSCAPMAERCGAAQAALGWRCVEQSEISEHSEHSGRLADARLWLGVEGVSKINYLIHSFYI
ncbi:MAG: hypothetical protein ACI4BC_11220 [Muribaculaceae bacterium]